VIRDPLRMCLGCRKVKPKEMLVRLVREAAGRVVVDVNARRPGRGAYICADAGCVERALQRGRLAHAFRKPCDVSRDLADAVRAAGRRGAAEASH
jgi:predicted RNA-binding protein YlxR (DUF448 family)